MRTSQVFAQTVTYGIAGVPLGKRIVTNYDTMCYLNNPIETKISLSLLSIYGHMCLIHDVNDSDLLILGCIKPFGFPESSIRALLLLSTFSLCESSEDCN